MPDTRIRTAGAAAAAAILALLVVLAGYGLRVGGEDDGAPGRAAAAAPARPGAGPRSAAASGTAATSADGESGSRASRAALEPQPLRYDIEYPNIGYSTTPPTDRVADLVARLETGDARLEHSDSRGWLDSLLRELDIDPDSQVLVFSATSLQTGSIRASTPRAIYFNDDTYVAWVGNDGPIEIASMDPKLGPIFYTLPQSSNADFERETARCLRCHDSVSLSGGGVPRFIVGSGYIGPRGTIMAHEGWILTSSRTPLRSRWGGWYVTGQHGEQVHLGNIVVRNVADLQDIEALRVGNVENLDGLVDTSAYASGGSDIVALMVMQHQIDVQNEISRVNFMLRGGGPATVAAPDVAEAVEPLVEAMLGVGEVELSARIEGSSGFSNRFERRGPADSQGRSLRELDLERRLLRYPLSYLVYSSAFEALPEAAKAQVFRRFHEILSGQDSSERFAHLSAEDRTAVLEILTETHAGFAAAAGTP